MKAVDGERIIIGLVVRERALEEHSDGGRRITGEAGTLVAGRAGDDHEPCSTPPAVCTVKSGCSRAAA